MKGETVDIEQAKNADGEKRERSTIEFPYGDLNDATLVAEAINTNAGVSCTTEQLAAYLGYTSATGGSFRLKMAAASTFGITDNERGRVTLTDLGRRLVNPNHTAQAKVQAFLHVPLYKAVFDKYGKHMLPPAIALEREMVSMGVAQKQAKKARQAFERSATQAGFFAHGTDRLVLPAFKEGKPETMPLAETPPQKPTGYGGTGGGGGLHPLIQGLLLKLPEPDQPWSTDERVKWLRTAANIFGLLFEGDGDEIAISKRPKNGSGESA